VKSSEEGVGKKITDVLKGRGARYAPCIFSGGKKCAKKEGEKRIDNMGVRVSPLESEDAP